MDDSSEKRRRILETAAHLEHTMALMMAALVLLMMAAVKYASGLPAFLYFLIGGVDLIILAGGICTAAIVQFDWSGAAGSPDRGNKWRTGCLNASVVVLFSGAFVMAALAVLSIVGVCIGA